MKMKLTGGAIAAIGLAFFGYAPNAEAGTWNLGAGGSWNAPATNWSPAAVPNAVGANATFNNAASGSNPAQTANRTVTLDGTKTVGSIAFNNDAANAFTNTVSTGSGGPLVFDELVGSATISVPAVPGTGNNTISVAMRLDDSVIATVGNVTATSAAGALNLTGAISGTGGITKLGDGLMTFGTGAKTYTGATVLSGGRTRSSFAAQPSTTSSFTINTGAQLTLITTASIYTLGPGSLNLNGNGPTTGPFAAFPGAIRNDTGIVATITNPVNLQSNASIHVQGTTASTTLSGSVSGVGGLIAGVTPHDANLGAVILSGTNGYSGGSTARAGNLVAAASSVNAFGSGDVSVESANLAFAGSQAKISLLTGATNAIDDSAYLFLAGGATAGVADDGFADLGAGINEVVRRLYFGGLVKIPGTYGSTASAATYQFNEYFAGTGIVTVLVPEPASFMLVFLGAIGLVAARRVR